MIVYDGQAYTDGSAIPDMGSLVCTGVEGNKRFYGGLYTDRKKLPKYDNLATGSDATLTGNGNVYYFMYDASTKKWHGNGEQF